MATAAPTRPELVRGLGLAAAIAINVANMIGTGVFLKARVMTCNVGSASITFDTGAKDGADCRYMRNVVAAPTSASSISHAALFLNAVFAVFPLDGGVVSDIFESP